MWPIVVAIIGFMAFYTWVQFSFRKLEDPYLPSQAMQNRARAAELKNMYGWYSLPFDRVASESVELSLPPLFTLTRELPLENELPSQVVYYLPRKPILLPNLELVGAHSTYLPTDPYYLAIQLPSDYANHPEFYLTTLYKESELLILPELRVSEKPSGLSAAQTDSLETIYFSIDAGPLTVPSITVKLYNASSIYQWQIHAKSASPAISE